MLYKQLNDQRTQGGWEPFEGYYYGIDSSLEGNNKTVVMYGEQNEKSGFTKKIDAQYTCLAVNNLHHLAEALEYFASLPLAYAEMQGMTKEVIKAKEALNRIS